jgi:hypothetical protein
MAEPTTQEISVAATSEQYQLGVRLESIFMPHARKQREALYMGHSGLKPWARFVHYTSAEAALKIIESKRVWMRNTTCMADYSEVQHGFLILQKFFADEARKRQFYDALNAVSPNIAEEAFGLFDQWWNNIRFSTYITSISEHDDKEDLHGRLSMWRAFGGNTARVAVVLRLPWFSAGSEALNLMVSPVAYLAEEEAHAMLATVIDNLRSNHDFLASIERSAVVASVFNLLVAGVTCLKHEGFHEEREWRVIYGPERSPSELIEWSIEVVGGVPQMIYKLPLDVKRSEVLAELDLARIFDRLIIGPSQFSWSMHEAFTKALTAVGVEHAETRVCTSGIPIRS